MSNLIAIGTGVALAAILVAAGGLVPSVRRGEAQPSGPAAIAFEARLEMDMPVMPKADRLPLPELLNLPDTAEGRTQDAAISGATRGGKEAAPMTVVRAVGAASTKLDPVCGPRGRTYYTKGNGWRYWKCVR